MRPSRISCSVFAERPRSPRRRPGFGRSSKALEIGDTERRPELADGLRAETRDLEEIDEGGRELGQQSLVIGEVPGPGQLLDLVRDRLADARDLGRVAVEIGLGNADRRAPDGVGSAVVGHGLEDELALDLEEVADLVEDARQVGVAGRIRDHGPEASQDRSSGTSRW